MTDRMLAREALERKECWAFLERRNPKTGLPERTRVRRGTRRRSTARRRRTRTRSRCRSRSGSGRRRGGRVRGGEAAGGGRRRCQVDLEHRLGTVPERHLHRREFLRHAGRRPLQTRRHALEQGRRQRRPAPSRLRPQRTVRRLLAPAARGRRHARPSGERTKTSHTPCRDTTCRCAPGTAGFRLAIPRCRRTATPPSQRKRQR